MGDSPAAQRSPLGHKYEQAHPKHSHPKTQARHTPNTQRLARVCKTVKCGQAGKGDRVALVLYTIQTATPRVSYSISTPALKVRLGWRLLIPRRVLHTSSTMLWIWAWMSLRLMSERGLQYWSM